MIRPGQDAPQAHGLPVRPEVPTDQGQTEGLNSKGRLDILLKMSLSGLTEQGYTMLHRKSQLGTYAKQHPGQSDTRQDIIHLWILLAIALCVGIYLIVTTAAISRDSVIYIEYAKKFVGTPTETMLEEDQHPGYPVMILAAHKTAGLFTENGTVFAWIHSAQSVTLAFRLLAIVVLYLLGKDLVGPRFSFWGVLIIILLPKSAQYGSNALSDWPHLFFLATGFFLLIRAATSRKLYLFALAGITAGLGYLVRPECAQLLVYGLLWLGVVFLAGRTWGRPKTVLAVVLLLVGFLIVAGPYMGLKAKPFPKKSIDIHDIVDMRWPSTSKALLKLGGNIGDTLEWVFVPAWIIGLYGSFRKTSLYKAQQFFVIAFVVLNVALMIWLYKNSSYMDKRHTFPLVVFTIYYVPGGIELLASWLGNIKGKKAKLATNNKQLVFYVLLAIGIAVCVPQLFRPLNYEKLFLRKAAQWLAANTDEHDPIALFNADRRIAFYAQRRGIDYDTQTDQEALKYAVTVLKLKSDGLAENNAPPWPIVFSLESRDEKSRVVVYGKQY